MRQKWIERQVIWGNGILCFGNPQHFIKLLLYSQRFKAFEDQMKNKGTP